ncbi:MAG: tRNA (guanosine(37)-N1)-methyltransferase TrmD [Elusimicrobia bacterium]|nr:tRNA (guanosine(37)-N1)-methyltransferase TrmD [Elusimicrobiota bacterium]
MRIDVVTLFPEMFEPVLSKSIVGRARASGSLDLRFVNPRDFTEDKHHQVDDRPFGGGAGMVLMAEPVYQALKKTRRRGSRVVFLSPQGKRFDQAKARQLAKVKHLVLLCGHYEGIDERVLEFVDDELSIGDFVLTGGEIPAMAVVDAIARLLPGVLAKKDAAERESFSEGLLDFPQFTRPRVWRRRAVPDVLLSGDHRRIDEWRRAEQVRATRKKRPDLLRQPAIAR